MNNIEDNTNRYNVGMSMVEILVVMIIFVVIASIGFNSIVSFKTGTELNSASSQFESTVRTVENNARNNVASRTRSWDPGDKSLEQFERQLKGYLLYFDNTNNTFHVRSCVKSPTDTLDCSTIEPSSQSAVESVTFRVLPDTSNCNGVFYEALTGTMRIYTGGAGVLDDINEVSDFGREDCNVQLKHINSDTRRIKQYQFNINGSQFNKIS